MPKTKRRLFVKSAFAERVDLEGKTMIVTGASPGSLGFETARTLASWGAEVVITTRNETRSVRETLVDELPDDARDRVTGHPLDLCDPTSVTRFVRWYLDVHGERLDVLINNAGVHLDLMSAWKAPRLTEAGFDSQWRTTYPAPMHIPLELMAARETTAGATGEARVVNVVSRLHF